MDPAGASPEQPVREVIERLDAAWRLKRFEGLEACFHPEAVIVGPGGQEFARGRDRCAESYREFATNASVLAYRESGQALRVWEGVAIYTFAWEMDYERPTGRHRERGTDQLVLQRAGGNWEVVWRCLQFEPAE